MEKLVRHHVPDQLRARGEKIETRVAAMGEMRGLLRDKLVEEVSELIEALDSGGTNSFRPIYEEMADVADVLDALAKFFHYEHVNVMFDKRNEKGDFHRGIVMKIDAPVPTILMCPKCNTQHVDKGIWADVRVHRSHLCAACGAIWRPFAYATVGVESLGPPVTP